MFSALQLSRDLSFDCIIMYYHITTVVEGPNPSPFPWQQCLIENTCAFKFIVQNIMGKQLILVREKGFFTRSTNMGEVLSALPSISHHNEATVLLYHVNISIRIIYSLLMEEV